MKKLYIIIPAYNESANVRSVVEGWHEIAVQTGVNSRLVVIDDGSRDNTYALLTGLAEKLPQLTPLSKPNSGHGATVLYGYHYALESGADYIFQTDSDGQTLPAEFWTFWEQRKNYSALIGYRKNREDGLSRILVTKVLRMVLRCVFRLNITDANTPFRLIKAEMLKKYLPLIPSGFNLSNVMLTVCLLKYHESVKFIPITFRPRQGGINSINFRKITEIGIQAVKDFRRIGKELRKNERI